MKTDNKQTTRELAIEFWDGLLNDDNDGMGKQQYIEKYKLLSNSISISEWEIEGIYLSEHTKKEETVPGKEVSNQYHYVIIKHNYPELERESTLSHNKYNAKKKYAFINKGIHKDGSESIYYIDYSNDLELLQKKANEFISWYNYPLGLTKNIQQYISTLN